MSDQNYLGSEIVDNPIPAGAYTTSMHFIGSFSVSSSLLNFTGVVVPDSFSFFDGRNTITNLNAAATFSLQTDSSGQILSWNINMSTAAGANAGDQTTGLFTLGTTGVPGSGNDFTQLTEIISVTHNPNTVIEESSDRAQTNDLFNNMNLPVGTWSVDTTPLPAALTLFATGIGGLGLLGWRRKKKAASLAA
jgi:hypothetical protein